MDVSDQSTGSGARVVIILGGPGVVGRTRVIGFGPCKNTGPERGSTPCVTVGHCSGVEVPQGTLRVLHECSVSDLKRGLVCL